MKRKPKSTIPQLGFYLHPGEFVVTAFAEPAAGPGWANTPVYAVIRCPDGKHRIDCLQPENQTEEIRGLYEFSALAHKKMTSEVAAVAKVI